MILRHLFLGSLVFYMAATMYSRFQDANSSCLSGCSFKFKLLYSLPLEFGDGRDSIETQICSLSSSGVLNQLKTNPQDFPGYAQGKDRQSASSEEVIAFRWGRPRDCPGCSQGRIFKNAPLSDYVVVRIRDTDADVRGDLKCYFSYLPFPIVINSLFMPSDIEYISIFPFPEPIDNQPKRCTIKTRWKNFWGNL